MKCPNCGTENPEKTRFCIKCKKLIAESIQTVKKDTEKEIPLLDAEMGKQVRQLQKFMQNTYSKIPQDSDERMMDQIRRILMRNLIGANCDIAFLNDVAKLIHRLFNFSEVTIGFKDRSDNLYKYIVLSGVRKETEIATRKLQYTYQDMIDHIKYPRIRLSEFCEFFPGEYRIFHEGEYETYGRPSLLGQKRNSIEDMIEGDYFCVYMYGERNELIGWFELGRTNDMKMPSRATMKRLEFFAAVIGRMTCDRFYR